MRSSQRSVRDSSHGITIAIGASATANSHGRAAPPGSALQPRQRRREEDAEHEHAQQDHQRALDDQVVELEAVLEIDRRDQEVDRRRARDARRGSSPSSRCSRMKISAMKIAAQRDEQDDHHVAQPHLIRRARPALAAQHQHRRVDAGQREQAADRDADPRAERSADAAPCRRSPRSRRRRSAAQTTYIARQQLAEDRRRRRVAVALRLADTPCA